MTVSNCKNGLLVIFERYRNYASSTFELIIRLSIHSIQDYFMASGGSKSAMNQGVYLFGCVFVKNSVLSTIIRL